MHTDSEKNSNPFTTLASSPLLFSKIESNSSHNISQNTVGGNQTISFTSNLFSASTSSVSIHIIDLEQAKRRLGYVSEQYVEDKLFNRYKNVLLDKSHKFIRIHGFSGLGKTALAVHSFSSHNNVAYLNANGINEHDAIIIIKSLTEHQYIEVLIIDNCSVELHKGLYEYQGEAKLVTIGIKSGHNNFKNDANTKIRYIHIQPSFEPKIKQIIQKRLPEVAEEIIDRVVKIASGSPSMAIDFANSFGNNNDINNLTNEDLLNLYLWHHETFQWEAYRAIQACALFNFLGWEGRDDEYELIAEHFCSLEPYRFYQLIEHYFIRHGLVEKYGQSIRITFNPIAWHLARQWFEETPTKRIVELINHLLVKNPILFKNFGARLGEISSPKVVNFITNLRSQGALLGTTDILEQADKTRLFKQLCFTAPQNSLNVLQRVFSSVNIDFLTTKNQGQTRRELVRCLTQLAAKQETFHGAVKLLFQLALAENERWGNHATGKFAELFRFVSKTEATLENRFIVLQELTNQLQPEDNLPMQILLKALTNALEKSSSYSREDFISLERPIVYCKPAQEEHIKYWKNCQNLLFILAQKVSSESTIGLLIQTVYKFNDELEAQTQKIERELVQLITTYYPNKKYDWLNTAIKAKRMPSIGLEFWEPKSLKDKLELYINYYWGNIWLPKDKIKEHITTTNLKLAFELIISNENDFKSDITVIESIIPLIAKECLEDNQFNELLQHVEFLFRDFKDQTSYKKLTIFGRELGDMLKEESAVQLINSLLNYIKQVECNNLNFLGNFLESLKHRFPPMVEKAINQLIQDNSTKKYAMTLNALFSENNCNVFLSTITSNENNDIYHVQYYDKNLANNIFQKLSEDIHEVPKCFNLIELIDRNRNLASYIWDIGIKLNQLGFFTPKYAFQEPQYARQVKFWAEKSCTFLKYMSDDIVTIPSEFIEVKRSLFFTLYEIEKQRGGNNFSMYLEIIGHTNEQVLRFIEALVIKESIRKTLLPSIKEFVAIIDTTVNPFQFKHYYCIFESLLTYIIKNFPKYELNDLLRDKKIAYLFVRNYELLVIKNKQQSLEMSPIINTIINHHQQDIEILNALKRNFTLYSYSTHDAVKYFKQYVILFEKIINSNASNYLALQQWATDLKVYFEQAMQKEQEWKNAYHLKIYELDSLRANNQEFEDMEDDETTESIKVDNTFDTNASVMDNQLVNVPTTTLESEKLLLNEDVEMQENNPNKRSIRQVEDSESHENLAKRARTSSSSPDILRKFEEQTSGLAWEQLKNQLVMQRDNSLGEQEAALDQMKTFVSNRDIVDFFIYRQAVEAIFPSSHYNLFTEIGGQRDSSNLKYKASWYSFVVTAKSAGIPTGLEKPICCKVKVNAPGSRTLTSDIDTSISAKFSNNDKQEPSTEQIAAFLLHADERLKKGIDYAGRIANAVINGFYSISQQEFSKTSSLHRDSNAYLAVDDSAYAKFTNNAVNNPIVMGQCLFEAKEYEKAFFEYKKAKHQRELAGSLFLLRSALDSNEWQAFKQQLEEQQSIIEEYLLKDDNSNQQEIRKYKQAYIEDIQAILARVDKYYKLRQESLASEEQPDEMLNEEQQDEEQRTNRIISLLNKHYVDYLEQATSHNSKLMELKGQVQTCLKKVSELEETHQKKLKTLNKLKNKTDEDSDDEEMGEIISKKETELANIQLNITRYQEALKQNLRDIAKYSDSKHEALVIAHLFANEAYTSRYAVEHVVKGMQEKRDIVISDQTILGSALQQIGFKLLHAKELHEKGKSEGEISYLTAKYGYRVFNLLFHDKAKIEAKQKITGSEAPVSENAITILAGNKRGNTLNILHYLKSPYIRPIAYTAFTKEQYMLLNSEAEIAAIKKSSVLDSEKPQQALAAMQKRLHGVDKKNHPQLEKITDNEIKAFREQTEKTLFLSIGAILTALTCTSMFERKQRITGYAILAPQTLFNQPQQKASEIDNNTNAKDDSSSQSNNLYPITLTENNTLQEGHATINSTNSNTTTRGNNLTKGNLNVTSKNDLIPRPF